MKLQGQPYAFNDFLPTAFTPESEAALKERLSKAGPHCGMEVIGAGWAIADSLHIEFPGTGGLSTGDPDLETVATRLAGQIGIPSLAGVIISKFKPEAQNV
jgi:hypothetical protein